MLQHLRSLFRLARTLKGSIALGISSLLLIVGIAMAKATAQSPNAVQISPTAAAQIQALVQEKESRTPAQQKISSAILYTIKARLRRDNLFNRVPRLNTFVKVDSEGKVRMNIRTNAPVTPELLQKIEAYGAKVLIALPDYKVVQVLAPLDQVEPLATLSEVRLIRPFIKPRTVAGQVTSEGDIAQGARLARATYGVDGTGVKVGVLSDSYNNLGGAATDIANGDLPSEGVTLAGSGDLPRTSPSYPGSDEGRAMLQIIHDLVPGAKLYFATANSTQANFASNIRALRRSGCDIILDDVSYFAESVFQDGTVAQAVNDVTANGALYFSSAGNSGNKNDGTSSVWEGDFVDGGQTSIGYGGRIHSFGSTLFNRLKHNSNVITLQWSDPLDKSANDYDLYVLSADGTHLVASSNDIQNGNQDPIEMVNPQAVNSRVIIAKYSGQARFLNLNTNVDGSSPAALEFNTRGATSGHSAAEDAYSVAAVNAQGRNDLFTTGSANSVEKFSSDGPRRIFYKADGTPITPGNFLSTGGVVRQKPDIAAADGVVTTLPANSGLNPFFGTSAAAPHAAGVAALLKSFSPSLTPQQIRTILTTTALDIEASGVDQDSGYGIVMANRALRRAVQIP